MVGGGILIAHGLKVQRDAVRRADLILPAIALADGAGLVIVHHEVLGKLVVKLHGGAGEDLLLAQGQNGCLEGGQRGVEVHDHTNIILAVLVLTDNLFIVSVAQNRQYAAFNAQRGLDDIGDIFHHVLALALAVDKLLAADVGVLGQVIVSTVGHAPQLAPAEGEQELKVRGGLGVEAQLLGIVVAEADIFVLQADGQQPVMAERAPIVEPLKVRAGLAEEFQLHLLELADAEDKVARSDLVTEGLTDLTDAEGQLFPGGTLDIVEVHKDALCRFGTEVHSVLGVLRDALKRLEHQVELTDVGEVVLAASGAGNVVLLNEVFHLDLREGVHRLGQFKARFGAPVLNELIGAEALVALAAVHQRVGEAAEVSAGHPSLRVHEDSGIQTHVIGVLLHELLPPGVLDVFLQLRAEGAIVPGVGKAAVNFAAGEHEAPVLAQGNDFVHGLFGVVHDTVSFSDFLAQGVKNALSRISAQGEQILVRGST